MYFASYRLMDAWLTCALPDAMLLSDSMVRAGPKPMTAPVFGHLFGDRHHAVLSTEKTRRITGLAPSYGLSAGHQHTYEWFTAQGWASLDHALADPVWRATWDFAAEAAVAAHIADGVHARPDPTGPAS